MADTKADYVAQVRARAGVYVTAGIDPLEFPHIVGMEGPFLFGRDQGPLSYRTLYYDTREGKYYDSKSDLYVEVV